MEVVLKNAEKKELTDTDIRNITNLPNLLVVPYHELDCYNDIFEIFGKENCFVLLYEQNHINEGHYIACIYHPENNTIESFDSLGYPIDKELDYSNLNKNKYYTSLILKAVQSRGCRIVQNTRRVQRDANSINTCGRHVSVRLSFRHLNLQDYLDVITGYKHINSDDLVSLLTMLF